MFFVATNALTYSVGSHDSAFLSTSVICITLIYFENKTQKMLMQSFEYEKKLIRDLEKLALAINKMPEKERNKIKKIYESL